MFSESTGNGNEVVVMQICFLFRARKNKQTNKQIDNIFLWSVILSTIEMMLMIKKLLSETICLVVSLVFCTFGQTFL